MGLRNPIQVFPVRWQRFKHLGHHVLSSLCMDWMSGGAGNPSRHSNKEGRYLKEWRLLMFHILLTFPWYLAFYFVIFLTQISEHWFTPVCWGKRPWLCLSVGSRGVVAKTKCPCLCSHLSLCRVQPPLPASLDCSSCLLVCFPNVFLGTGMLFIDTGDLRVSVHC